MSDAERMAAIDSIAVAPDVPVFLLTVFAKNEKANLTVAERNMLATAAKGIATAYGR